MKIRLFLTCLLALCVSVEAWAGKRVALVIGNGDYKHVSKLANPANDARLMANTLSDLGFVVISEVDATYKQMDRAVFEFGQQLEHSGNVEVAMFFYAGHGVQIDGVNYLIPVDENSQSPAQLKEQTIAVKEIQRYLDSVPSDVKVIIMDACRNNPFRMKTRSIGSGGQRNGLATMRAAKGTIIGFSTAPGDVAADGRGSNSPYTEGLVRAMNIPGLSVERMFKEARSHVMDETRGDQVPWESSSLTGRDVYFNPGVVEQVKPKPIPVAKPKPKKPEDEIFWEGIKDGTSAPYLQAFIEKYPNSKHIKEAKMKLMMLQMKSKNKSKSTPQKVVEDDDVSIIE